LDLYGKKVGVVSGEHRFTYHEFVERAERLAFGLLSEGVALGDRVAFLSFNTHQLLEGYYAAPLIRGIVMPLNVRLAPAELASILNHAEPRILFTTRFRALIQQLRQACPAVEHWFDTAAEYEEFSSRGCIQRPDIFSFNETEIAELFYTSGSTAVPRASRLAPHPLYAHAERLRHFLQRRNRGRASHHPALHANRLGPSAVRHLPRHQAGDGAPLRPARRAAPDPGRARHLDVARPTMANALLNCPEIAQFDYSSLRQVQPGGGIFARARRAHGEGISCPIMAGYGLTGNRPRRHQRATNPR
jgi:fatty-acyl-CoA synthase